MQIFCSPVRSTGRKTHAPAPPSSWIQVQNAMMAATQRGASVERAWLIRTIDLDQRTSRIGAWWMLVAAVRNASNPVTRLFERNSRRGC
jgi:hypothetical protein